MRCRDVQKELLSIIADGKEKPLSKAYEEHLESCESCRQEWKHLRGWGKLLKNEEPWKPEEGFYERLVETGMREKQRAALTESVSRDLLVQPFNLFEFLQRPIHLPRFVPAAILALLLFLPLFFIAHQSFNTIGSFDFSTGSVYAYSDEVIQTDKGGTITKGTSIQTAQEGESIVKLRGGTEILIASLSRIVVEDARTVHLERGRAYFDIQHGKGEFRVTTPSGEILVLGTAFDIRVENEETLVTVTRGTVQITGENRSQKVNGGFEGILRRDSAPQVRQARLISQTERWVASLRQKRNMDELQKYYPSLSVQPTKTRGRK